MRKLLRLLLIVGIIAFAVGMTALSCEKTADPPSNNNNNANNNSGGSGGGGDGGGGTPAPQPSPVDIVITNLVTDKVKIKGDTIYLNAMGFPNDRAMWTRSDFAFMSSASATQRSKLFEVVITGGVVGDAAATGGLVVASYGNKDKFADMNITGSSIGAAQQGLHDPMNIAMTSYYNATGTDLWSGLGAGVSIFSAFTDDTTTPGYSFGTVNPAQATGNRLKPIFFCSTTLSDVKAQVTANVSTTTKLTGGQKAICWVSTAFNTFINTASPPALIANGTQWLAAAETTTFKKTIEVTFAGIRTDAKTVVDIGLPGATDVAKATAFSNGLTKAEMTALAGANPTGAKKYKISIVSKTVFDGL